MSVGCDADSPSDRILLRGRIEINVHRQHKAPWTGLGGLDIRDLGR